MRPVICREDDGSCKILLQRSVGNTTTWTAPSARSGNGRLYRCKGSFLLVRGRSLSVWPSRSARTATSVASSFSSRSSQHLEWTKETGRRRPVFLCPPVGALDAWLSKPGSRSSRASSRSYPETRAAQVDAFTKGLGYSILFGSRKPDPACRTDPVTQREAREHFGQRDCGPGQSAGSSAPRSGQTGRFSGQPTRGFDAAGQTDSDGGALAKSW